MASNNLTDESTQIYNNLSRDDNNHRESNNNNNNNINNNKNINNKATKTKLTNNSNNNNNNNNSNNNNKKRGIDSLDEDNTVMEQRQQQTNTVPVDCRLGEFVHRVVGQRQPKKKYRLNDDIHLASDHDTSSDEDGQSSTINSPPGQDIRNELADDTIKEKICDNSNNNNNNKRHQQQRLHPGADTNLRMADQHAEQIKQTQKASLANGSTLKAEQQDPAEIMLRFLIRRREAGAIIGKRGSNIRQLRDTFNSEFLIPDTGNGPERVLSIATNHKQIDKILKQLSELLYEKSLASNIDEQVELRMLIHSSHAGTIIGKGGNSIKKLREESNAAIKIFALCCPLSNERVIAIKGKPSVVVSTIKLVMSRLSSSSIKGAIKPYDALNFDQNISDRYGGYQNDDTDLPPNGPFIAPQQQLSPPPPPFSPQNSFNNSHPTNQYMPNHNNYRLQQVTPIMSSHQNCPTSCSSPVFANRIPTPCTNCHHQRADPCGNFVHHRQLPYHHQLNHSCGNRLCSSYQMPNSGPNNARNGNNMHNGHKFHHVHM